MNCSPINNNNFYLLLADLFTHFFFPFVCTIHLFGLFISLFCLLSISFVGYRCGWKSRSISIVICCANFKGAKLTEKPEKTKPYQSQCKNYVYAWVMRSIFIVCNYYLITRFDGWIESDRPKSESPHLTVITVVLYILRHCKWLMMRIGWYFN